MIYRHIAIEALQNLSGISGKTLLKPKTHSGLSLYRRKKKNSNGKINYL